MFTFLNILKIKFDAWLMIRVLDYFKLEVKFNSYKRNKTRNYIKKNFGDVFNKLAKE